MDILIEQKSGCLMCMIPSFCGLAKRHIKLANVSSFLLRKTTLLNNLVLKTKFYLSFQSRFSDMITKRGGTEKKRHLAWRDRRGAKPLFDNFLT